MENNMIEHLTEFAPPVVIAMVGAAIQSLKRHDMTWRTFFAVEFSAGFGAFIISELLNSLNYNHGVIAFAAGMIGWSGGTIVDEIMGSVKSRVRGDQKAEL